MRITFDYDVSMDLYARVNILEGRAVRLRRGLLTEATALDADPLNRVKGWTSQGVEHVLVVDLDAAAYGSYRNRPIIDQILDEVDVKLVVAGGVRSDVEATRLIERGAWRVMMGTAAIEREPMVWDLCHAYPGRITVSLDVLEDEELLTRGWAAHSGRFLEEVMIAMSSSGVSAFFVTDARRDVLHEPPNISILRSALEYVEEPIIAAGGVRNLQDLHLLRSLEVEGRTLSGLVVGREVTEGRITIEDALSSLAGPLSSVAPPVEQMRVMLPCRDLEQSTHFYEEGLGLQRHEIYGRTWLEAGKGHLLELRPADGQAVESTGEIALEFLVDNLDAWTTQLDDHNIAVERDVVKGHRRLIIQDPDGRYISFFELIEE